MNNFFRNSISILAFGLAASLSASVAVAQEPARQGPQDAALESLRAGAVSDAGLTLISTERAELAAASAPILETLRATNMSLSDHETTVILVTVAVVVLIVLLV